MHTLLSIRSCLEGGPYEPTSPTPAYRTTATLLLTLVALSSGQCMVLVTC